KLAAHRDLPLFVASPPRQKRPPQKAEAADLGGEWGRRRRGWCRRAWWRGKRVGPVRRNGCGRNGGRLLGEFLRHVGRELGEQGARHVDAAGVGEGLE